MRYHFPGISGNLEMSGNSAKVREKSGNLCSQGNLIVAPQQHNLPVIYLYCHSFFICDVHGEFGLINVHLFDILPAISSGKVRDFARLWIEMAWNSRRKRPQIILDYRCRNPISWKTQDFSCLHETYLCVPLLMAFSAMIMIIMLKHNVCSHCYSV